MPKVQIKETYKYGSSTSDLTNFTAYIPVKGVVTQDDSGKDMILTTEPTLYKSYKDLYLDNYDTVSDVIDFTTPIKYDDQDTNYLMARKLLEKGLPVLIEGIEEEYPFTSYDSNEEPLATGKVAILGEVKVGTNVYTEVRVIENSVDPEEWVGQIFYYKENKLYIKEGAEYTDTGMTVVLGDASINIDFDRLVDKALYNIRFLTLGKYNTNKDLNQAMIKCAAARKDAIALLDHIEDLSEQSIGTEYVGKVSEQVGKVRTYFETLIKYTEDEETKTLSNDILKNAGAFTPWFKATLTKLVEGVDKNTETSVPASFGYLSAFISSVKQNPEYFAIAGSFRGDIKELTAVDYNYTSAEVEILQGRSKLGDVELDNANDNLGLAINPISKIIPFGYLINGNRTMYITTALDDDYERRPNYRAILSIRNLVCSIAKQAYYASKKYTFEPNTDITYINFKSEITPLLDKMRSGLGIRGYRFDRLVTTAKGRISAKIDIKPIEPVEDFDITIELDDSVDIVE